MQMTVTSVDGYVASAPDNIRPLLQRMQSLIKKAAPGGEDTVSYNMPAYKMNRVLVWYAGCKTHIGFYPSSTPIRVFKDELTNYKTSRGAIQFPLDKPLPAGLITRIVKFRLKEDKQYSNTKKQKK